MNIPIFLQVQFEWFNIVVESQGGHCEQDILTIDRLTLLCLFSALISDKKPLSNIYLLCYI